MGGNEYFMQVSVCFKYCLALLIFGVSHLMTWLEANGSWNALNLAMRSARYLSCHRRHHVVIIVIAAAAAAQTDSEGKEIHR
jgi:hypothetical protein